VIKSEEMSKEISRTKLIRQQFQINFSYDLIFTSRLFDLNNTILVDLLATNQIEKSKVLVVLDYGVSQVHPKLKASIKAYFGLYSDKIELAGSILEVPGGEQVKNSDAHVNMVLEGVNDFRIDRHSYVVVIGGGAVIDAVGFAAAIAHRGVRLVRVPTTVLSQNDSGVGVKNGINYFGKKNFMGSFATPYAIINDEHFLTTLDDRNWRSGISEAIKVALIKDIEFFNWIENNAILLANRDMVAMHKLIYRCAEMHMEHIRTSGDPFEQGSSRPLDFGHWAAHKLEQISNYEILHGEAVAIGVALDSTYSYLKGYISESEIKRILDCILNLGFSISYDQMNDQIIAGLEEFREHLGGKLTIMLLESLGKGFEVHEMDDNLVLEAINYMNSYSSQKVSLQCK
jgi:3-dehydroquinate synthase